MAHRHVVSRASVLLRSCRGKLSLRGTGVLSARHAHCRTMAQVPSSADAADARAKVCLVVGGNGALGRAVVTAFAARGWTVVSADKSKNDAAGTNVLFETDDLQQQVSVMKSALVNTPGGKADAIVCTAGGWAGGGCSNTDALLSSLSSMTSACLFPIFTSAAVAGTHLGPRGLLVLVGAAAALGPTPGMLAYGAVKAGVSHMTVSLAAPDSGLPACATVLAVLPHTLDTPSNRQWMGGADTSTWTTPGEVADRVVEWAHPTPGSAPRPPSGTLLEVVTEGRETGWRAHAPLYAAQMR